LGNGHSDKNTPAQPPTSLEQQIRVAAYRAWMANREDWQERSELDAVIAEPFRRFVDIDITGLAHALVENGSLHTLPAIPLGVWVFNGDIA
jgi:hypothetical protein